MNASASTILLFSGGGPGPTPSPSGTTFSWLLLLLQDEYGVGGTIVPSGPVVGSWVEAAQSWAAGMEINAGDVYLQQDAESAWAPGMETNAGEVH